MDRKATAGETLRILKQGYYEYEGKKIDILEDHTRSVNNSVLITPEEGAKLLERYEEESRMAGTQSSGKTCRITLKNISTVDGITAMAESSGSSVRIGVLNFASAKNPGGGFLNGAMAQEESLAASSGLYKTLTVHETYYRVNRATPSMIYTDHGIYSPDVVFFRDGRFKLAAEPVKASVLTLPAVNMGQVLQKGEDVRIAEQAMRRRMAIALAIFADRGHRRLILGAYGCGVFRNDPALIAGWWKELLEEPFGGCFDEILFAVLDRSVNQACIRAFHSVWGGDMLEK